MGFAYLTPFGLDRKRREPPREPQRSWAHGHVLTTGKQTTSEKGKTGMKWRWLWVPLFILGLCSTSARADNRVILRTTLNQQALQAACNPPLLPSICTVVGGLGDPLGQLFLITTPLDLNSLLNLVGNPLGIIDAELDQLLSLVGGLNQATTPYPA